MTTPPVNSANVEKFILEARLPYAPKRPQCNSILHLFGAWLFDASLTGVRLHPSHAAPGQFFRVDFYDPIATLKECLASRRDLQSLLLMPGPDMYSHFLLYGLSYIPNLKVLSSEP